MGGHTATSISAAGRLGSSASASISTGGHTATSGSGTAGGQMAISASGTAGGQIATSGSGTAGGQMATSGSGTAGGEMATSGSGAFGSSITISSVTTGATGSGFDLIGSGIGAGEGGCAAFFWALFDDLSRSCYRSFT